MEQQDRNSEATIYVGNLDERVNDALLWELMLQAGPVVNVHLPKDRVTTSHQGFGFAEFVTETDADYAVKIMNQIRMFGKPIRVNKASADKKHAVDTGAELFVGNLDPSVDERLLYDTFSIFGTLLKAPSIARDEGMNSKGFGFVTFADFEASDKAIDSMDNQFLANKSISVSYAFRRDGKGGGRHGDQAERLLANQAKQNNYTIPAQIAPPTPVNFPQPMAGATPGATPGVTPAALPPGFTCAVNVQQPPPPPPAGFPIAQPSQAPAPPPGLSQPGYTYR